MVVVGIIAVMSAIVMGYLSSAKNKGNDAGIKENLRNANSQAEIFWNTNTVAVNTYTNVCQNVAQVGGANTIALFLVAAAKDASLGGVYTQNPAGGGTGTTATCNDSATAWAAEVPMYGSTNVSPTMWCVDNTGKSKQESVSIGTNKFCN